MDIIIGIIIALIIGAAVFYIIKEKKKGKEKEKENDCNRI
jgi:uncharacterized membrane protein YraQ (UPF0718 family)